MQKIELEKFLLEYYDLDHTKVLKTLETRGDRSAFLVVSKKIKYVVKIMPHSDKLESRMIAQQKIHKAGFSCPGVFTNKEGKVVSDFCDKDLILFEFIIGTESYPNVNNFYKLGLISAELHNLHCEEICLPKFRIEEELPRIQSAMLENNKLSSINKDKIVAALKDLPDFMKVEQTLLHCDLSFFNLIKDVGQTFLIDFDRLSVGSYVFDLGHVIAFSCCLIPWDYNKYPTIDDTKAITFYSNWMKSFVAGYKSERQIKPKDAIFIYEATLACCLLAVFDAENNRFIHWNLKRYFEIKSNKDLILEILSRPQT